MVPAFKDYVEERLDKKLEDWHEKAFISTEFRKSFDLHLLFSSREATINSSWLNPCQPFPIFSSPLDFLERRVCRFIYFKSLGGIARIVVDRIISSS